MATRMLNETHFLMIVVAPKTRASTSSVKTASIIPVRLRYANSASASPSALLTASQMHAPEAEDSQIDHSPLHAKDIEELFHPTGQAMRATLTHLTPSLVSSGFLPPFEEDAW
jgi:hypothetical protein